MKEVCFVLKKKKYSVASERIRFYNLRKELTIDNKIQVSSYDWFQRWISHDYYVFSKFYDKNALKIAKSKIGKKIVLDICDYNWYKNDSNIDDLSKFLDYVSFVTCTTKELKDKIIEFGMNPNKIHVIPDSYDFKIKSRFLGNLKSRIDKRKLQRFHHNNPDRVKFVWFGNAFGSYKNSGTFNLLEKLENLSEMNNTFPLSLVIISNENPLGKKEFQNLNIPIKFIAWNINSFFELLKEFQIAFLPIEMNPFNVVKSHNRLTTALRANLYVISDEIPSYEEFKPYSFISNNYIEGYRHFLSNQSDIELKIEEGKAYTESNYSPRWIASKWINLFN